MGIDGTLWRDALPMLSQLVGQLLVAALLGSVLGLERRWQGQAAALRTTVGVAVGACGLLLIARQGLPGLGTTRVNALLVELIVLGTWVLGLRLVLHYTQQRRDVNQAVTLWISAALGMAVGSGQVFLAVFTALFTSAILALEHAFRTWAAQRRHDDPHTAHQEAP